MSKIIYFVIPLIASGTGYYVDFTNGNDSNPGAISQPLKYHPWMSAFTGTITLQPGDTVYMKRGEQWIKSNPTSAWLTVQSSGAEGNYIVTTAYGSGAKPLIKIDTDSPYNVIYAQGKSYIVFDNLHIQHWSGYDYGPNTQDGIHFEKDNNGVVPHHWIITNCEIDDIPGIAIQGFDDCHHIVVGDTTATQIATPTNHSNNIHHFFYSGVSLLGRDPTTGESNFKVYYNYIHDATNDTCVQNCYGISFSARISSSGWPVNAIGRYNRIEHIKGWTGLDCHGGSYIYYQDNYVYDCLMSIAMANTHYDNFPNLGDHYFIERNIFENPSDQVCNSIGRMFVSLWGRTAQPLTQVYFCNNKIFFTTRPSVLPQGKEGISLYNVENVLISGNEIYNSGIAGASAGIYFNNYDTQHYCNVTIKNNYLHDWYLYAVMLGTNGAIGPVNIYYNLFEDVPRVLVFRYRSVLGDVNIYNNDFIADVGSGTSPMVIFWADTCGIASGATVSIKNNIFGFDGANTNGYYYYSPSGPLNGNLIIDNNLYYNTTNSTPFDPPGSGATNWSGWQGLGYDLNGLGPNVDPLFVNASGNFSLDTDFKVFGNSPAIDLGVDVGLFEDYFGTPVPQGLAPDIGFYEYDMVGAREERECCRRAGYRVHNDISVPNPLRCGMNIVYSISKSGIVVIRLYNVLGEESKTIVEEVRTPGLHAICWDGMDDNGRKLPDGVYFLKMDAGEFTETRKVVVIN